MNRIELLVYRYSPINNLGTYAAVPLLRTAQPSEWSMEKNMPPGELTPETNS